MLLNRRNYFVKERVAVVKLTDTYDILDPDTQTPIGIAKEEPPTWAKWLRLVIDKRLLPTAVNVYEAEGQAPALRLRRGPSFFTAVVAITGRNGEALGSFQSKLFSIGGAFRVFDAQKQQVAEVKGDWKGWNFRFLTSDGRELGLVTKKWAGVGRELFTSSDNYMVALHDAAPSSGPLPALLLAAGLAIDIVFKEKQ